MDGQGGTMAHGSDAVEGIASICGGVGGVEAQIGFGLEVPGLNHDVHYVCLAEI